MKTEWIEFEATILRKQDDLPRYVVVKPEMVAARTAAFAATVSLNGGPEFRRNVRPWGKGSAAYFFNLTAGQCRKSAVETGDRVLVSMRPG